MSQSTGTELQRFTRKQVDTSGVPGTLDEAVKLGEIMGASGMFDGVKPAQAIAKVIAGRELGIGPMAAMRGIDIIKGKVRLTGELTAALIKGSGRYDFIADVGDDYATVTVYDRGEARSPVTFTIADAERAGLIAANPNYKKYPGDMCFTKAIARACRRHCPEVAGGAVYIEDEDDAPAPARTAPQTTATVGEPEPLDETPNQDPSGSASTQHPASPAGSDGRPGDGPQASDPAGDPAFITDGQLRGLWARFRESGHSEDWLRSVLEDLTGQDSTKGIPPAKYDEVMAAIDAGPAAEHAAAGGEQLPGMETPPAREPGEGS